MTRHYAKLKEYVALVSKDYGTGERLIEAVHSDLAVLGKEIGVNVMLKGQELLHSGIDRLAATGMQKLSEIIAGAGKKRR